uniref:Uncharacterized protein n=1 Tax=Dunaliella tertiolecta TaxID=3047 RepID=A0A7S3VM90_DUNTE|mmetsp:Transcript_27657/g.74851  ORF Transcript_27657/g.74851 Transcript_27657/m.74851 type:complete len:135 (-) Transcript_27657:303-707(-)
MPELTTPPGAQAKYTHLGCMPMPETIQLTSVVACSILLTLTPQPAQETCTAIQTEPSRATPWALHASLGLARTHEHPKTTLKLPARIDRRKTNSCITPGSSIHGWHAHLNHNKSLQTTCQDCQNAAPPASPLPT